MLASTKDGPVIQLLALWIRLGRPFQRKRLPLAPGTVRRLILVHGAQFLAQYFADIAGQAHVALGGLHAGALGGVLVERHRHVFHVGYITRISCNYAAPAIPS